MKLQTTISIPKGDHQIDYGSKVLLLGSCFSEHIGDKLEYFKFKNSVNPFGIVFHPLAVEKLIDRALNNQPYGLEDIFQHNDLWHCYEVHSQLDHPNKETFLANLNQQLACFRGALIEASHVVITLGTAWVYRLNESGLTVANCHKMRQTNFQKSILGVEEISDCISRIALSISELNKDCKIIFTVSPVRHLKDGFTENNRSKSHLIAGIHNALGDLSRLSYFPSFEIMMDELRDYRFYDSDMIHPNELAVNIIWEKFCYAWIDSSTNEIRRHISEIQLGLRHKPFHPESDAHLQFLKALQKKIEHIQKEIPGLKF